MLFHPHVEQVVTTARATVTKNVTCEHCRSDFHYVCTYTAKGKAHCVSGIGRDQAFVRAGKHAIQRAAAYQSASLSPAICPRCGRLQRNMVDLLRRKAIHDSQMHGWIAPGFLIAIAVGALALVTDFFSEPPSNAWKIGTGLIALTGIAMFIVFGLGTWVRSRTWDCSYFGKCDVAIGQDGTAEPSAEFEVIKTTHH